MYWSSIELNMSGTSDYIPSMPWIYKFNDKTKRIDSYVATFVDNVRSSSPEEEFCERDAH